MTKRPYTDLHDVVNKEVESHMRPFIQVTMEEHEKTRKEVKDLREVVCKVNKVNYHDVVQYALIALLLIGMSILLQGC